MAQAFTRTSCICTAAEKALLASSDLGQKESGLENEGQLGGNKKKQEKKKKGLRIRCNTCGKAEGGGGKKMEHGTDYDDHILNYVLHINKHHISCAVIFKAFPLCITEEAFNPA